MSESREFLLALTLLFVLGAWAATAEGLGTPTMEVIDLSDIEISAPTEKFFSIDELTTWKGLQFYAAAMVKPTVLENYELGMSASISQLTNPGASDTWKRAIEGGLVHFKIGSVDQNGTFRALIDSSACPPNSKCDSEIWEKFATAASSSPNSAKSVVYSNSGTSKGFAKTSDLTVFWTGNRFRPTNFGSKSYLESRRPINRSNP